MSERGEKLDRVADEIINLARWIDDSYAKQVFRVGGIPVGADLTDDQQLIHDLDSVARRLYARAVAERDARQSSPEVSP